MSPYVLKYAAYLLEQLSDTYVLAKVIDALPEMTLQPRDAATNGHRTHRRDFENTVRNDIIPQMIVGQQHEPDPIFPVFCLNRLTVERQDPLIGLRIDPVPTALRSINFNTVEFAEQSEKPRSSFVPVGPEIGELCAPILQLWKEVRIGGILLTSLVVRAYLRWTSDSVKHAGQERRKAVGNGEVSIVREKIPK